MNRRVSERTTLEGSFFFIIQNPPLVELKIVLDDLYNFFKFNLYGYNTNTIKKYERFQYFPLYFPPSKALPSKLPNKT
jgi:hypothetical protein